MRLVAIGFAYTGGVERAGARDIEGKMTRVGASKPGGVRVSMERRGARDIEGKVTRVGASKPGGERVSIKKKYRASCRGTLSCRNGMRISFLIRR